MLPPCIHSSPSARPFGVTSDALKNSEMGAEAVIPVSVVLVGVSSFARTQRSKSIGCMKGCSSEKRRQSKALGAVLHTFFAPSSSGQHSLVGWRSARCHVYHDAENAAKTDENKTRDNKPPNFIYVVLAAFLFASGCIACEDVGIGNIQSIDEMHICFAWKEFSRVALVFFMVSAAGLRLNAKLVNNLLIPIVPPPLPAKLCVYVSGVAELLGGLLLIANASARYGAWVIIATLVAVFPANVRGEQGGAAQDEDWAARRTCGCQSSCCFWRGRGRFAGSRLLSRRSKVFLSRNMGTKSAETGTGLDPVFRSFSPRSSLAKLQPAPFPFLMAHDEAIVHAHAIEADDPVAQQVREIAARLAERTYPGGQIGMRRDRRGRGTRPALALPVGTAVVKNEGSDVRERLASSLERIKELEEKIDTLDNYFLKAVAVASIVAIVSSGLVLTRSQRP